MSTVDKPLSLVNRERLLQCFLDLVKLDSPSGSEGPVCDYLIQLCTDLGLSYQMVAGDNLIVSIPGNINSKQTLAITAHMDVVPPCIGVKPIVDGEDDNQVVRSSGDTVLGADDKAALAPLFEALRLSLAHNTPRPNLLLLITTREEVMLCGAKDIPPEIYQHADFVIAMDHTGDQGTIIVEAPSYYKFTASVTGKSVHAGIMPERGVNAIKLLSDAMAKLPWGRLDEQTTANMATIHGGKATNIVPDKASVMGEVRGHNEASIQAHLSAIKQALENSVATTDGAAYTLEVETGFLHYKTERNNLYLKALEATMQAQGITPQLIKTNGGSDINVFAQHGLPGVVLSAGYVHPHSLKEHVYVKDMVTLTELLLAYWKTLSHAD